MISDEQWEKEREDTYVELGLPTTAEAALDRLREEFDSVARIAEEGLDSNPFASIQDGQVGVL